jgi:hypothetical protein
MMQSPGTCVDNIIQDMFQAFKQPEMGWHNKHYPSAANRPSARGLWQVMCLKKSVRCIGIMKFTEQAAQKTKTSGASAGASAST